MDKTFRIVLLTDSLGCPREEIDVCNTWVERIIREFPSASIYPICRYGLSAKDIDLTYIKYLKPDVVICQIGIVDASRRALKDTEKIFFSRMPIVGKGINWLCSQYHYNITKIRNIHICSCEKFYIILSELCSTVKGNIYFLEIAPPGKTLHEKVYNIENDVRLYNDSLEKLTIKNGRILKPYSTSAFKNPNDYLLKKDGHHLNEIGEEIIFKAVREVVKKELEMAI